MGGLTCISFWTSHLCTLTYWGGGRGGALLIWGLLLTKSEVLYVYNIHINWSFLLACCFFLFLFLLYVCKIYVAH